MTSANVKFGAKIDSRALNSPHRRTRLASFMLPSIFSGKFAICCFYFPQLMFCVLTEARVFTLNVLNLAIWGLFWYRQRSCMLKIGTDPVAVRRNAFAIIGTFRSEDEDDYEYEFSVLSMRIRFVGRHFSKCACSEQKTRTRSRPRSPI